MGGGDSPGAMNPELLEQVVDVPLDCPRVEVEGRGDLLVGGTGGEKCENLALVVREVGVGSVGAGRQETAVLIWSSTPLGA